MTQIDKRSLPSAEEHQRTENGRGGGGGSGKIGGWRGRGPVCHLGARLRGRAATQCSEIWVLGRVLGKGSGGLRRVLRRGPAMGFYSKKRVLRRVLRRGSGKAVSRRCLEHPPDEYAPLGVRPSYSAILRYYSCDPPPPPKARYPSEGSLICDTPPLFALHMSIIAKLCR